MPRQNRVTPFGELIATPARGTLMGNRGCLHDLQQRIRRPFAGRRWIACVLQFKGRRRDVMAPGRYTELFFLDEATALAAGHRPCAECQRERYRLFREHWVMANRARGGSSRPSVDEIDRALHAERIGDRLAKRTYVARLSRLPAGAMVAGDDGGAYLVQDGALAAWTPSGYAATAPPAADRSVRVLTPRSIVRAIAHGYPVAVHDSARSRAGSRSR
ncbi:MAG: hypothetical protein E6K82_00355 [Candidatus Rokuibacteriota bacterium]|nr:MAG: hypothetical protein E6K82_00355 [Candidatus Rokubacteria bacterium]